MGIIVIPGYRIVSTLARKATSGSYDDPVSSLVQGLRTYVRSVLSMLHPSISHLGERTVITQFGDPEPRSLLEALIQIDEGDPKAIAEEALSRCGSILSRPDLNARVFLFPGDGESRALVNQMSGVNGFSLGSQAMIIFLWPTENWEDRLSYTIAHEYVHLVRNLLYPRSPQGGQLVYTKTQTPETLMDAMVAEGIADHFALSLFPTPCPPWTAKFEPDLSQRLWPRVRRRLDVSDMNEIRRFLFGDGDRVPTWTGYKYGYQIVAGYLQKNPKARPVNLVGLPSNIIFQASTLGTHQTN